MTRWGNGGDEVANQAFSRENFARALREAFEAKISSLSKPLLRWRNYQAAARGRTFGGVTAPQYAAARRDTHGGVSKVGALMLEEACVTGCGAQLNQRRAKSALMASGAG